MHTLRIAHPLLPALTLELLVYPTCCRVAWRWGRRVIWVGPPCEA